MTVWLSSEELLSLSLPHRRRRRRDSARAAPLAVRGVSLCACPSVAMTESKERSEPSGEAHAGGGSGGIGAEMSAASHRRVSGSGGDQTDTPDFSNELADPWQMVWDAAEALDVLGRKQCSDAQKIFYYLVKGKGDADINDEQAASDLCQNEYIAKGTKIKNRDVFTELDVMYTTPHVACLAWSAHYALVICGVDGGPYLFQADFDGPFTWEEWLIEWEDSAACHRAFEILANTTSPQGSAAAEEKGTGDDACAAAEDEGGSGNEPGGTARQDQEVSPASAQGYWVQVVSKNLFGYSCAPVLRDFYENGGAEDKA